MPADNTFHGEPYPLNTRVALEEGARPRPRDWASASISASSARSTCVKLDDSGRLLFPTPTTTSTKSCYDVKRFLDRFPWLDMVSTTMNELGWDVYSFDHEDGNCQFEFDFKYADALTMCDRYIFFRHHGEARSPRGGPARDLHAEAVSRTRPATARISTCRSPT